MKRRTGLAAVAVGLVAAGVAAERVLLARERSRPDPAEHDTFDALPDASGRVVVTEDGARIRVVSAGDGDPAVVFVHGLALSSAVWHYQWPVLAERGRVVALDHRGHGASEAGSSPHGIDLLARDLAQVLRELDVRSAILVGHSMGGMTVMQYAADHPDEFAERCRGVVLAATSAGALNPVAAWQGIVRALTPAAARGMRLGGRLPGGLLPANDVGYLFARLGFGRTPSPTHVELTRALNAAGASTVVPEMLASLVDFDLRDGLEKIDVPAIVVVGTRDLLTPPRHGRLIAKRLRGSRLVTFDGAGHMLMLERHEEFTALLERFAEELS